jgi:hypothetical protein
MKRLAALVLSLFLLAAPAAFAGGPTSVILVNPGTGKTAALYNEDTQYISLMNALGDQVPGADPQAPDLHGGPGTAAINITWLMHDVQVWRIDHVFLSEKDGPWVETYMSYDAKITFEQRGIVHRPSDAAAMQKILHNLLDDAEKASPVAAVAPQPAPAPAPAPAAATGLHWGSMLVGLAVGAVLVMGFTLVRRRSGDGRAQRLG